MDSISIKDSLNRFYKEPVVPHTLSDVQLLGHGNLTWQQMTKRKKSDFHTKIRIGSILLFFLVRLNINSWSMFYYIFVMMNCLWKSLNILQNKCVKNVSLFNANQLLLDLYFDEDYCFRFLNLVL
jgi:hypothetical protein